MTFEEAVGEYVGPVTFGYVRNLHFAGLVYHNASELPAHARYGIEAMRHIDRRTNRLTDDEINTILKACSDDAPVQEIREFFARHGRPVDYPVGEVFAS